MTDDAKQDLARRIEGVEKEHSTIVLRTEDLPVLSEVMKELYEGAVEIEDPLIRIEYKMFCGRILHALEKA